MHKEEINDRVNNKLFWTRRAKRSYTKIFNFKPGWNIYGLGKFELTSENAPSPGGV